MKLILPLIFACTITLVIAEEKKSISAESLRAKEVQTMQSFYNMMDVDSNKKVTKEEFWNVWLKNFNHRDKDTDGKVDLSQYFLVRSKATQNQFNHIDSNKDGFVDLAEEKVFRMRHFQVTDVNKDAHITFKELIDRHFLLQDQRKKAAKKSQSSE